MIKILVTLDVNSVIGLQNNSGLLWSAGLNNEFIKTNMANETIVVGHNTYKNLTNIGKNAKIIVLSKKEPPGRKNNIIFYNSLEKLLQDYDNFIVIGGEQMYNLFLPIADIVLITMMGMETSEPNCRFFPQHLLEKNFYLVTESPPISDTELISKLKINLIFSKWERKIESLH